MCWIDLGLWVIISGQRQRRWEVQFTNLLQRVRELEQRVRELEHAHSVTVRTLWLGRCHGSFIATTIATNVATNIATSIASNIATNIATR